MPHDLSPERIASALTTRRLGRSLALREINDGSAAAKRTPKSPAQIDRSARRGRAEPAGADLADRKTHASDRGARGLHLVGRHLFEVALTLNLLG